LDHKDHQDQQVLQEQMDLLALTVKMVAMALMVRQELQARRVHKVCPEHLVHQLQSLHFKWGMWTALSVDQNLLMPLAMKHSSVMDAQDNQELQVQQEQLERQVPQEQVVLEMEHALVLDHLVSVPVMTMLRLS
jgi:methyl coenzyme M reductase subunit D